MQNIREQTVVELMRVLRARPVLTRAPGASYGTTPLPEITSQLRYLPLGCNSQVHSCTISDDNILFYMRDNEKRAQRWAPGPAPAPLTPGRGLVTVVTNNGLVILALKVKSLVLALAFRPRPCLRPVQIVEFC